MINHAGKGPNSGHYYAYVRSSKNGWYEMNDESVEPRPIGLAERNAYILFYVQEPGQSLRELTETSTDRVSHATFGAQEDMNSPSYEDVGAPALSPINIANDSVQGKPLDAIVIGVRLKKKHTIENSSPMERDSVLGDGQGDECKATGTPVSVVYHGVALDSPEGPKHHSPPFLKRKDIQNESDNLTSGESHRLKKNRTSTALPNYGHANPFGRRELYKDRLHARNRKGLNVGCTRAAAMRPRMQ